MNNLSNLEPKNVFHWFYELNQIPRNSGHEQKVSDFLVKFAKDRNLEVHQDELLNVIIKKPGTPGYEKSETVIIQGHMDMVCVKTDDSNHDFATDPIEMIVEGDVLRANNTTLGGDDGIAVAMGLAILDSDDIPHPPIELLVTTSEETGMDGAMGLKNDHLSGAHLLNIDTEKEGDILVSCSGGGSLSMTFDITEEPAKGQGVEMIISGLKGGHSGMEIHKQRGNAIKFAGRILYEVKNKINLSYIEGGIKHNAVPAYVKALFTTEDFNAIKDTLSHIAADIKEEYRVEEPGLKIDFKVVSIEKQFTKDLSSRIINFIMMLPDGVQYMSKDIEGLVQTSLNNAIIETKDGKVTLTTSVRSASVSSLREIINVLKTITDVSGGSYKEFGEYPAWQYEPVSKLRDITVETYKKMFGKEPNITSIHAGLECGLLKNILPNTDMVSFGPDITGAHTPEEQMSISSVQRVWEFTKELLKNLK